QDVDQQRQGARSDAGHADVEVDRLAAHHRHRSCPPHTVSAGSLRCGHRVRGGTVDLDAFVAEHEAEWRRLELLSRRRRLSAGEADELVVLYQRAATHLSAVRSRLPDPSLVARLSRLVLTARAAVTGGKSFSWHGSGGSSPTAFPWSSTGRAAG